MAVRRERRAPKQRSSAQKVRDRLDEAEAVLDAIRTGRVDALMVSGPGGAQTVTIDGATHPYFVLLNAMSDGAALLEPGGAILFANRSFAAIVGVPLAKLRGAMFQRLVAPAQRSSFEEFLHDGARGTVAREVVLATGRRRTTPVAIVLSMLPLESRRGAAASESGAGTTLLMAIVTDLTYRKRAEATRARLLERLISAEDDERRRLARELHDETGQSLAALLVGLRAIADMAVPADARAFALRLRDVAAQTVDDVGRLARGLHPAVLDDKGLAAAAQRHVSDYGRSFRTAVEFVAGDLDSPRLPPLAAATMYRILQEALTNVARHAHARKVEVELTRGDSALELTVRDDGVGFDPTLVQQAMPGLGLRGMRERATLLGGSIELDSRLGRGTTVRARIPIDGTPRSARKNQRRRGRSARRPGLTA